MKGGFIPGQARRDGVLGRVRPGMTVGGHTRSSPACRLGEVTDINLASLLVDTNMVDPL